MLTSIRKIQGEVTGMEQTIRCPECGIWFKQTDEVYIDEFYFLNHEECKKYDDELVMDKGTFIDIRKKHLDTM